MCSATQPPTLARLLGCLLLTSITGLSSALASPLVPADIAYQADSAPAPDASQGEQLIIGTAELPIAAATQAAPQPAATSYLRANQCPDSGRSHDSLQKSLVFTRFLRSRPHTANAGNLYAAEVGLPELIRAHLNSDYHTIGAAVIQQGFALSGLNDAQLKQHAQKIARSARSQFVLSGTINDMAMTDANTTYNPSLYRQAANGVHDLTGLKMFDKRTRVLELDVELRDGFTGELLLSKRYATRGIWNSRAPMGFDSPAFFKTPYGKKVVSLTKKISADLARTVHCQPFMASVDAQPGQAQIVLYGGANNGLHAGDKMNLYQVIMVGSNSDYQVSETRLVKRATRLHLSEVYPSHSVAMIEGGDYLNGQYLAVSD